MDAAEVIAHRPPSASLARALEARLPDEKFARAIEDALVAVQVERDGTVRPDHKTRLQAATLGLHYKHGRPVERQEIITANLTESPDTILARLRESPALQDALRRLVEEAKTPQDVVVSGSEMRELPQ